MRKSIEISHAISEAVRLADVDVIAAYPITPQTHIVERLASMVSDGELEAEFILVESEQTAMAACIGACAVGARTFTSTSSQGLQLMSEMLYIASGLRMPVVMVIANRSLSAPLSIWNDHSDIMANRDCGWIQLFAKDGQSAFDMTLQAYKIGENHNVLLPVGINIDGFIMTHVTEAVDIPDEGTVRRFLPAKFEPLFRLHPDAPISMGPVGHPDIYPEAKKASEEALLNSKRVILEVWREFEEVFGRRYEPVEVYRGDSEILIVTMGSIYGTGMEAVDIMREKGKSVGIIAINLWRPFPFDEFLRAVEGAKKILVIDRAISPGGPPGPLFSEIRSFLFGKKKDVEVYGFVLGLGGRDVRTYDFERIVDFATSNPPDIDYGRSIIIGLRE